MTGLTLAMLLRQNALNYPEKLAVVDVSRERRYTYRQFNARVNQLANGLTQLGIGKGDKVSTLMHDRSEFVELLFALAKIGAVLVPLNYRSMPSDMEFVIINSEPKALVFEDEYASALESLRGRGRAVERYITLGDKVFPDDVNYEAVASEGSSEEPDIEVKDTDIIVILYTSGTTGGPKGVIKTHRTALGWALDCIIEFSISYKDRFLNMFPMYHHGGWIISIITHSLGATNYILGGFDPTKFLKTIQTEKITHYWAAPTMINMVLKLPEEERAKYDVSSVRSIVSAAAPLMTETKEAILKYFKNAELFELYSSTEAFFTVLRPEDQLRKIRCHGKPGFGMEIRLLNEKGEDVPQGEVGVIYGRGVSVFDGYYKNDAANSRAFNGEWFTAEDLGRFDEEGYLYVVDRKKDMILTGGENVPSVEVEDVLMLHPKVLEAAAIGIPDEIWGERVHAVLALKPGETATEEEIIEWCKDKLAGFKRPRSVEFMPELPKNPSGKILKRELRSKYREGK